MSLQRIIIHWTAGTYSVHDLDREHYHFIVGGDGTVTAGIHKPEANLSTRDADYAAHTLHCNTGSIGVSMACMGNAVEQPFSTGPWPMKEGQFKVMVAKVAEMAKHYGIPVLPTTILTHAEVEPTLGIKQRGKWDITRIPFRPDLVGHKACGDFIRAEVAALMH
jgi:hypothetical protein